MKSRVEAVHDAVAPKRARTMSVPKRTEIDLDVVSIPADPDGGFTCCRLGCQEPLNLHQPEIDSPTCLLSTYKECNIWHFVTTTPDGTEMVIARLAVADLVKEMLAAV